MVWEYLNLNLTHLLNELKNLDLNLTHLLNGLTHLTRLILISQIQPLNFHLLVKYVQLIHDRIPLKIKFIHEIRKLLSETHSIHLNLYFHINFEISHNNY